MRWLVCSATRPHGGTLLALEHGAYWAELVSGLLRREALDNIAHLVHAPLEGEPPWYSHAALSQLPDSIDLLLVDGPPAFAAGHERRRESALQALDARLTADASVILDDIDRPGEQQTLAQWELNHDWSFDQNNQAGVAVGTLR